MVVVRRSNAALLLFAFASAFGFSIATGAAATNVGEKSDFTTTADWLEYVGSGICRDANHRYYDHLGLNNVDTLFACAEKAGIFRVVIDEAMEKLRGVVYSDDGYCSVIFDAGADLKKVVKDFGKSDYWIPSAGSQGQGEVEGADDEPTAKCFKIIALVRFYFNVIVYFFAFLLFHIYTYRCHVHWQLAMLYPAQGLHRYHSSLRFIRSSITG